MSSDQDLVLRAAEGESDAFGALYDRYLDAIFRYAFYRVASPLEAEDLTERVFLKALAGLAKPKAPPQDFRAWLFTIARHEIVDHYRRKKTLFPLDDVSGLEDGNPSPEEQFETGEKAAQLASALGQLTPEMQEVITLRFISGLSHSEAAEIMNIKEGYVRVLQFRALKQMRAILQREQVADG